MSENFTLGRLLIVGGPTLFVLIIAMLIAAIVVVERWLYFRKLNALLISLHVDFHRFIEQLDRGDLEGAKEILNSRPSIFTRLLSEVLETVWVKGNFVPVDEEYDEAKGRSIVESLPELERYQNTLATLGSVSPFIGLLGTVLGIIRAFTSLGRDTGDTGLSGLNAGIAEALVTTAAGLFVAIPATIAYNYYRSRVDHYVMQMELMASRLKSHFRKKDR